MSSPIIFLSSQSGAPTLTGQTGKLTDLLSAVLVVNSAFAAVSGASFLDRTAEARLDAGTPFTLFQTPGTSDEFYLGMPAPFDRATFNLATLGVGGTHVWEYWNGSSWTSLTVTDGTSGFTQNGKVTWSIPGSWATTAVNSVTQYWVRVRLTGANSTNPTANYVTVTGWIEKFSGASKKTYQSTVGNALMLRVQDDGPGVGTFKEARITGYETMSSVDAGTNPFPTAAQGVGAIAMLVARKSATADGTARNWVVWADDRTFYVFALTGDAANTYLDWGFGEFYSLVNGDSYRTILMGRTAENSAATNVGGLSNMGGSVAAAVAGNYVPRKYDGSGTSFNVGKTMDAAKNGGTAGFKGVVLYPNTPDGGLYICPIWINDGGDQRLRGRIRGLMIPLHPVASFTDAQTFSCSGAFAGQAYYILKQIVDTSSNAGHLALMTTDTVETN